MAEKVLLAWSGGKDSTLSLQTLRQNTNYTIIGLLTTLTETYDRISMHGVRRALLERQAAALGLPVYPVWIPPQCSNDEYAQRMENALRTVQNQGVATVAFGDLFLEDIRVYREQNLAKMGMTALFPLWEQDTHALAQRFIDLGFRGVLTCVDTHALDGAFAGRELDAAFLRDLPDSVDPCGENGEFHTFVFDGPIFSQPVAFTRGETVLRDNRFMYIDLIPPA